ncbi:family 31 glucosidase [Rathayibacter sp. VKM Ac-2759]|uniref:glycoside hydrolase family 31 protein n=1 Tax=Rathayibacter sp. VKM Ac-2759 TaxID=2609252 RepID=UPI0013164EAE|nr:TIM-barrel domain-containing protein [Rathayibacter sp. VKM Ac-2759]QHC67792.1 family 31 glucosidase [Rathayibacter sp. VKM Ac-2759]
MTQHAFDVDGTRLVWRGDGETIVVEPWGADSVRVRAIVMGEVLDTDWALVTPEHLDPEVTIEGSRATLRNGGITVVLEQKEGYGYQTGYHEMSCALSFFDARGELLFSELGSGGALKLRAREQRAHLGGDFRLTALFETAADEKLYGMGQYQQDILDLKGCTLELAHRNSQSSVPFVLSSRGYGFLWHNPAIGRATFAANRTEWFAESSQQLDYWVTAGDTPADITRAYADATGHVPMMPEHGLGFWQCKLRYWNQEQLLEVAREHKRRGLPMDVIVADFFHWPHMGDFRFEEEFWPDPSAMVAELRELGIELMVSVWPQVSVDSENYVAMKRGNLLVKAERGLDLHMQFEGPSAFYDATNPAARRFVWDACRRNYGAHGIRLFWLDEAEPEYGVYDFDNYRYAAGPTVQVGNLYPQAFSRGFYEGQREGGETEIVNLVRTAWAGSQRYGALVWSGDIHSTFADLRHQITAGIHMGVAGIPWFTTDIGGFAGGDPGDPEFRELLVRWFQFGAFSPVMRLHGDRAPSQPVQAANGTRRAATGAANEIWSFGDEVTPVLTSLLELRELLRPYTREVMREAHESGQPVMRGVFHGFPDDPVAWTLADQYLFGPDLLVAPVTQAGARSREVYLPAGARWTELSTGAEHDGGRWITAAAPLPVVPVFARDGRQEHLVGAL